MQLAVSGEPPKWREALWGLGLYRSYQLLEQRCAGLKGFWARCTSLKGSARHPGCDTYIPFFSQSPGRSHWGLPHYHPLNWKESSRGRIWGGAAGEGPPWGTNGAGAWN